MVKRLFILAVLCWPFISWGNALQLSNIVVNQPAQTVTVTLQWQNSWRVNVVPFNWDAVWLFVKWRNCGVDPNTAWTHGSLDLAGSTILGALEASQRDGTPGMDADNLGLMLRQAVANVYPTAGPYTVTMSVTNLPVDDVNDPIDVKVFGIEMVFVPEGQFTVGDGNLGTNARQFTTNLIDSEDAIALPISSYVTQNAPATFPKGFRAFYIMKYELSQGQYAAFLNTLNANGQVSRALNFYGNTRNLIGPTGAAPELYVAERPDRACNYLSWADLTAYLDWSGLRPMTELEFEKTCRGPLAPTINEYAWGSTTISCGQEISTTVPSEDGSEVFLPMGERNCRCASLALTGGFYSAPGVTVANNNQGPVRVGIFALPTSTSREATGSTYYGVMEMSGNAWEWAVMLSAEAESQNFIGALGDGVLDDTGNHNVATWPAFNYAVPNTNNNPNKAIGGKGGAYNTATGLSYLRTSDRYFSHYQFVANGNSRSVSVGGRGVR